MTRLLMDYPAQDLVIDVTTKYEQDYRANPTKKEPWTVAWIDAMDPESSGLVDVGANVGSYTLIAASRGVKVVAIEPGAANYAKLVENIRHNRLQEWVLPVCAMATQGLGIFSFGYSDMAAGAASHNGAQVVWTQRALGLPLDGLIGAVGFPATHLKLDVDGAELHVLEGAKETLSKLTSAMLEVNRSNIAAVSALMQAAGLTLTKTYDTRDGRPIPDIVYQLWGREPSPTDSYPFGDGISG